MYSTMKKRPFSFLNLGLIQSRVLQIVSIQLMDLYICMTTRVRSVEVDGPNGRQTWDGLSYTYKGITGARCDFIRPAVCFKDGFGYSGFTIGTRIGFRDCYNQNLQSASVESALRE